MGGSLISLTEVRSYRIGGDLDYEVVATYLNPQHIVTITIPGEADSLYQSEIVLGNGDHIYVKESADFVNTLCEAWWVE